MVNRSEDPFPDYTADPGSFDGAIPDALQTFSKGVHSGSPSSGLQRLPRYKANARFLRTIPGIGPLTTVQLLAELEDVNRFDSFRKLNSFVGFKPTTHASGEHDWRGRITYRQHKGLRSALVECAWTTVGADPVMMQRYEELKKRLTAKRAIIIIARKLLSRIYFVLKNQKPYELGRVQ